MNKNGITLDGKYIKRQYDLTEARALEGESTIEGHAAVYGQVTNIGGIFNEIISPGAFERSDLSDVALYLNHNIDNLPMARSRKSIPNSTMKATPDDRGLFISATLDAENNMDSKALISAISRKDVTGMSFCFIVGEEQWEGLDTEMPTRTIMSIAKVIEVSAVTYPAYEGTDIGARSGSLESDKAALERAKGDDITPASELEIQKRKIKMKARIQTI